MTLVVGYDDSTTARAALAVALDLARDLGDEVVVVYGVRPPGGVGEEYAATEEAIAELGRAALADARLQAQAAGAEVEAVLVDASPRDAVVQVADERDARMIVVGAHGPGTVRSALLGSTTRRVLLETTRPVLVVQPPADDA